MGLVAGQKLQILSRAIDLLEHWQETCVLKLIGTTDGLAVAVHAEPAEQFFICVAIATPSHSANQLCRCYVLGLTGHDDHADCVHSLT